MVFPVTGQEDGALRTCGAAIRVMSVVMSPELRCAQEKVRVHRQPFLKDAGHCTPVSSDVEILARRIQHPQTAQVRYFWASFYSCPFVLQPSPVPLALPPPNHTPSSTAR